MTYNDVEDDFGDAQEDIELAELMVCHRVNSNFTFPEWTKVAGGRISLEEALLNSVGLEPESTPGTYERDNEFALARARAKRKFPHLLGDKLAKFSDMREFYENVTKFHMEWEKDSKERQTEQLSFKRMRGRYTVK